MNKNKQGEVRLREAVGGLCFAMVLIWEREGEHKMALNAPVAASSWGASVFPSGNTGPASAVAGSHPVLTLADMLPGHLCSIVHMCMCNSLLMQVMVLVCSVWVQYRIPNTTIPYKVQEAHVKWFFYTDIKSKSDPSITLTSPELEYKQHHTCKCTLIYKITKHILHAHTLFFPIMPNTPVSPTGQWDEM